MVSKIRLNSRSNKAGFSGLKYSDRKLSFRESGGERGQCGIRRAMTGPPDENSPKQSVIEQSFLGDETKFKHDLSAHFIELCDACRRGDLEAVQT